jgi:cystathionine beta-lyase family protein involved in aluminum resistance
MEGFKVSDKILKLSERVMADVVEPFKHIDDIAQKNTEKVLSAFRRHRVTEACFSGTTGYGYDDKGRDTLEKIYADVMGTESALVRIGFVSGTHAICSALFALAKPGDTLLSVTGTPYDTLHGVIGITGNYKGSLKDYGINYSQIELNNDGSPNHKAIAHELSNTKVSAVLVQRSRGYSTRRALTVNEIGEICETVRAANPNARIFVDNCYGEFTETIEPGFIGADLMAGSLIKNPGGGLAPTGGYIAGKEELVQAASYRMTAPGVGGECGATMEANRLLYQGFFLAPHVTAQAIKTAVFCARLYELLGYKVHPGYLDKRSDIIQMIKLGTPELLERFCKGIQAGAPINSFVTPVPGEMPGYDCPVIMAAGAFIQGASIELSADAPMREPYNVFLQGGLTFESGKLGVMLAATFLES